MRWSLGFALGTPCSMFFPCVVLLFRCLCGMFCYVYLVFVGVQFHSTLFSVCCVSGTFADLAVALHLLLGPQMGKGTPASML